MSDKMGKNFKSIIEIDSFWKWNWMCDTKRIKKQLLLIPLCAQWLNGMLSHVNEAYQQRIYC